MPRPRIIPPPAPPAVSPRPRAAVTTPDPCPSPQTLTAFRAGRLPPVDAARVAARLNGCSVCQTLPREPGGGTGPAADAGDLRTGAWGPAEPEAGAVVAGRYKLVNPLGEGGMGTVWMAQQTEPVKRAVAVKLITPGMDSRQVLARFKAERQALPLMDHPNVARILDAGQTEAGRTSPWSW